MGKILQNFSSTPIGESSKISPISIYVYNINYIVYYELKTKNNYEKENNYYNRH